MSKEDRRRRRERKREENRITRIAARAVAIAEAEPQRVIPAKAKEPLTDISQLMVSPADVMRAGTATEALRWFVARCEPMTERKALSGLRERRIAAYLPMQRRCQWVRGRKTVQERPLFVGYLFVGLTPRQSLYEVKSVSGIEGMVQSDGEAAVLDAWMILPIALGEASGRFDATERKAVHAEGETVQITGGIFAGHIGTLISADRAKARVMLSGRTARGVVQVNDEHIEAVDDAA